MSNKQNRYGLQFNVSQLLKEPTGATRHYQVNTKVLDQLEEDLTVTGPFVGQVKLLRTGSEILVQGQLTTTIRKSCGRCLEEFEAPATIEIEEQFYPSIDVNTGVHLPPPLDADEATRINEQHILDLLEVVRQAILLESDTIRYCRPECRGICLQCGQNLNVASCDCQVDAVDMRWAGLLEKLNIEDT